VWQQQHPEYAGLRIAVNVSGRQLQDAEFVDDVRAAIRDTGISADTVVLEITETVLLPGEGTILERLDELAALGVHLYIDDFGTGYSSLSYLQQLPVDGIKLAQEFVEALPGTSTEAGLVRTIRDLADTLGLAAVVAEGIERPEQWRSLLALGYELGQGFHLAMPMPAESVDRLLAASKPPVSQPSVRSSTPS
jgi:EAL domain-containing protein (putative c-di-GMP-specific phosphodiesterase class I)